MRRVLRHLFTLCSAASLGLCVAVCVLWVRSHTFEDGGEFEHAQGRPEIRAESRMGRVYVGVNPRAAVAWHGFLYSQSIDETHSRSVSLAAHHDAREFLGFAFVYHKYDTMPVTPEWAEDDPVVKARVARIAQYIPERTYGVIAPHWFVVAVLSVLPAIWIARRLKRARRLRRGYCPACGYDLRASPDRCPECGSPASPAAATPATQGAAP